MNFTMLISWRRPLIAVTATFAIVAAACGGSGSAADGKPLNTEQADAIAHRALLVVTDLPGIGWTLTEDDKFEESPNADTKACREINARRDEAKRKSDPERAGRAQRAFSRVGKDSSTDVDIQVNIFSKAAIPAETLRLQRAAYDANLRECFSDTLKENADPSVTIEVKDVDVLGKLPGEGVAKALDVRIADATESLQIRLETYNWRFRNAGVTLNISGSAGELTPDLVKSVLAAAQAKLEAAAK